MNMNISTWSIRNPVPPVALFLVLVVIGAYSFMQLPVNRMPNVDLPVVTVSTALPGSSPAELVSQVVRPIEDELANVLGVQHIIANASSGVATVTVSFDLSVNSERALNDVKDAVSKARSLMPGTISTPVVQRLNVIGGAILTYAVSDPSRTIESLSAFVDDVVAPAVQHANGVASVTRIGGAARQINVDLDPDRLAAHGLTVSSVNTQVRQANIDAGGGSGQFAGQRISLRALGAAQTLGQLGAMRIRLPGGATVRLDQIGTITDGAADRTSFALLDGQPVVAFGVFRATGASDLIAAQNARAQLSDLAAAYPNVTFTEIDDATVYTQGNYHNAMSTLLEGAALTILVVMLFLRDWRATVVTLVALPLSVMPTFFVIDMLGFSLNTLSLLGITLVTGILVDDAIVEIENIVRHIHMGRRAYDAAVEAATEIGLTVIAISLTIVAVFAPVSFMGGIAGRFFKEFGLTVAVAVLFSLLVARLITPMFAAYFLRGLKEAPEKPDGFLMRGYLRVLRWTLRHKVITLFMGLGIFAGSLYSATLLPTEFVPASDTGRAVVSVELPPGSTMAELETLTRQVSARLARIPEMVSVFVDGESQTKATIRVNYGAAETRARTGHAIMRDIAQRLADVPDARIYVLGETGKRDVLINVLADTQEVALSAAESLAHEMAGVPQLTGVAVSSSLAQPEVRIIPRPALASQLRVDARTIANAARIATIGDTDANLARFTVGNDRVPIRVRVDQSARDNLARLARLRIQASDGRLVALGAVADIQFATGPASIERYDRQYRVEVGAMLAEGAFLGPATKAIDALPVAQHMPEGSQIQPAGDAQTMRDIFSSFGIAMGAGVMLVYIVLVLLFGSFVTPVTILLSLPLAIGGAIFALYLVGAGIGLAVVIGFLMLMGIVTKNAIMLVEFAIQAGAAGMTRAEAMIDAGHKRARPIIMTTVAMTAGMMPAALATGAGGEFRAPMAIAVIGGLLLSTLLSLLFVPSLYIVVERGRDGLRALLLRVIGAEHAAHAARDAAEGAQAAGSSTGSDQTMTGVRR